MSEPRRADRERLDPPIRCRQGAPQHREIINAARRLSVEHRAALAPRGALIERFRRAEARLVEFLFGVVTVLKVFAGRVQGIHGGDEAINRRLQPAAMDRRERAPALRAGA